VWGTINPVESGDWVRRRRLAVAADRHSDGDQTGGGGGDWRWRRRLAVAAETAEFLQALHIEHMMLIFCEELVEKGIRHMVSGCVLLCRHE